MLAQPRHDSGERAHPYVHDPPFLFDILPPAIDMIVLEDAPDSKVVRPQPRSRDVTADMTESSHLLPPPAYSSGPYRPNHTYDAPFQYPQDVIPPSQDRSPKGENARKRFVNAFVVAFVIWLLLAMLLETLVGFDVNLNVVKHVCNFFVALDYVMLIRRRKERKLSR